MPAASLEKHSHLLCSCVSLCLSQIQPCGIGGAQNFSSAYDKNKEQKWMPGGQQALLSQGIPEATSLAVFPVSRRRQGRRCPCQNHMMGILWPSPLALPKSYPPHPDLPLSREQTCQRALLFLLLGEGISGYKLYTDEVSSRYADSCFQFSLALILNIKQSRPSSPCFHSPPFFGISFHPGSKGHFPAASLNIQAAWRLGTRAS